MSSFILESDQREWAWDIESFGRCQKLLERVNSTYIRQQILDRMREIQARWPQFIKADEIPLN